MSHFIYNEDTRIHTLDGKVIPSVSNVIEPLSDFSKIPPAILARKTELGTQFHDAIHAHLEDDLVFDSLDPDLVKPMNTFVEWWAIVGMCFTDADMIIEVPGHHPTLKYCGKPDLQINNEVLYDWKLRPYMPAVDTLKLEGYKHMVSRKKLDLWTVCFDLEGKMSIHNSRHPKAWGIFRKLLEHYNTELEFQTLMKNWEEIN